MLANDIKIYASNTPATKQHPGKMNMTTIPSAYSWNLQEDCQVWYLDAGYEQSEGILNLRHTSTIYITSIIPTRSKCITLKLYW